MKARLMGDGEQLGGWWEKEESREAKHGPNASNGIVSINLHGFDGHRSRTRRCLRRNVARIHGRFGQGRQGEISDWSDGKTDKGGLELTSHEQMASRRQKR